MNTPLSFTNIRQMENFDPARSWLWDLSFQFRPFTQASNSAKVTGVGDLGSYIPQKVVSWIPADTLTRTLSIVESLDFPAGQTNFKIPQGTSSKDININFIDDYQSSIKDWLQTWMDNIILCNGNGVNYLSEIYDILTIKDLLPDHTVRKTYQICVYPEGPLTEMNTSDSSIKVYSQTFIVCGKN